MFQFFTMFLRKCYTRLIKFTTTHAYILYAQVFSLYIRLINCLNVGTPIDIQHQFLASNQSITQLHLLFIKNVQIEFFTHL